MILKLVEFPLSVAQTNSIQSIRNYYYIIHGINRFELLSLDNRVRTFSENDWTTCGYNPRCVSSSFLLSRNSISLTMNKKTNHSVVFFFFFFLTIYNASQLRYITGLITFLLSREIFRSKLFGNVVWNDVCISRSRAKPRTEGRSSRADPQLMRGDSELRAARWKACEEDWRQRRWRWRWRWRWRRYLHQ